MGEGSCGKIDLIGHSDARVHPAPTPATCDFTGGSGIEFHTHTHTHTLHNRGKQGQAKKGDFSTILGASGPPTAPAGLSKPPALTWFADAASAQPSRHCLGTHTAPTQSTSTSPPRSRFPDWQHCFFASTVARGTLAWFGLEAFPSGLVSRKWKTNEPSKKRSLDTKNQKLQWIGCAKTYKHGAETEGRSLQRQSGQEDVYRELSRTRHP